MGMAVVAIAILLLQTLGTSRECTLLCVCTTSHKQSNENKIKTFIKGKRKRFLGRRDFTVYLFC